MAAAILCSSSTSSLLLLLRQVLLMPAASSDFKAAACGAFFGAGAALLVSHLLLELTFSSVFSTFFALLFFLLSLLVLQRAFTICSAVPPPVLPAKEQEQKLQQQQQHWPSAATTACQDTAALAATPDGKREEETGGGTPVVPVDISRGEVEEIYLEEEREDAEAGSLLQQEHMQQEYYRFQKEQQQMRRLLLVLAAMLAGSALVAGVVDMRKFQTFHWLLKMSLYILLSNSLCFLLVFAAVDVVNFYYDVAGPGRKSGESCAERAAATPAAFALPPPSSSSSHCLYTALSTSSRPLPIHSLTDISFFPSVAASSSVASSLPPVATAAADTPFPSSTLGLSHTLFSPCAVCAAPGTSSAGAFAVSTTDSLPVHNTLQVYVLLGGSLLLGTTFGFFYGMFRFEANPHNSVQLIRSRYVCVPLAAVIGPLAGVLVKRIGDLSNAAAVALMTQQQQQSFGVMPDFSSASPGVAGIRQPTAAAAATHLYFGTASATPADPAVADTTPSAQQQQLFPISSAANFLEEEEDVEEENLLTFSAADHRQLLLLA